MANPLDMCHELLATGYRKTTAASLLEVDVAMLLLFTIHTHLGVVFCVIIICPGLSPELRRVVLLTFLQIAKQTTAHLQLCPVIGTHLHLPQRVIRQLRNSITCIGEEPPLLRIPVAANSVNASN